MGSMFSSTGLNRPQPSIDAKKVRAKSRNDIMPALDQDALSRPTPDSLLSALP
jgi:hypothetical protein